MEKTNPTKEYQTAGRKSLLHFFEQNPDCQFTADELCQAIHGGNAAARSSVYRHLGELCDREAVRKFRSESRGCAVYQYVGGGCDCNSHFHAKCVRCGAISHLDCDASSGFAAHLLEEHGFLVSCGQSLLYGVCAACRAKEEHPDG